MRPCSDSRSTFVWATNQAPGSLDSLDIKAWRLPRRGPAAVSLPVQTPTSRTAHPSARSHHWLGGAGRGLWNHTQYCQDQPIITSNASWRVYLDLQACVHVRLTEHFTAVEILDVDVAAALEQSDDPRELRPHLLKRDHVRLVWFLGRGERQGVCVEGLILSPRAVDGRDDEQRCRGMSVTDRLNETCERVM